MTHYLVLKISGRGRQFTLGSYLAVPMEESIITNVILPASMAIIMLGMGLSLAVRDFKNIFSYPEAALLGLFNQLLMLPAIGFILAMLFQLPPELSVGLIIVAACPGGSTSNLIAHVSNGDTALSITLTAISSVVTVFTIPLVVSAALRHFYSDADVVIQLPVLKTIYQIVMITLVPVGIGMTLKHFKKDLASKMEKPVRVASIVIFFAVATGAILANKESIVPYFKKAGFAVILLNISTMIVGYLSSKVCGLNLRQTITVTIESGVQNAILAMVIAASILKVPDMAIPPAVYAIFMLFTGGFMMWRFGSRYAKEE